MPTPRSCPKCGKSYPADELDGLCPTCVMGLVLDEDTLDGASDSEESKAEAGSAPTSDWSSGHPGGGLDSSLMPGRPEGKRPVEGLQLDSGVVHYFGDFELIRELGRGGMGVVFKARKLSLNRTVAIKMIRSSLLAGEEQRRRLRNEAEAVANLDHENIVPIFEVGEHEGHSYFAMKLIGGSGLDRRLGEFAWDARACARLVATVTDAVHHAHRRGILHRDLKPANILVDSEGRPHVTDFGLAKRIEGDSDMTGSGAILGTPAFMAPEQASGRRGAVTTATDVHGLGTVLYAMLAGRPPFLGDSVVETLEQVRERVSEAPSRLNRQVPRDLEVICLKCLEKDPRRRYDSAAEVADDLHRFLAGEPIRARPVGPATRLGMWCRRRPAIAGLLCSALLLATLVVVLVGVNFAQTLDALRREEALRAEAQRERDRVERTLYVNLIALSDKELDAGRVDRAELRLNQCRPDLRRWEWGYLKRLAHAEHRRLDIGRDVEPIAFTPDGRTLLRGVGDRVVCCDPDDLHPGRILGGYRWPIRQLSLSPDGRRLATIGREPRQARIEIIVRDLGSGEVLLRATDRNADPSDLSFDASGNRLAVSGTRHRHVRVPGMTNPELRSFGMIRVWSVPEGREILDLDTLESPVGGAIFAGTPERLITGDARGRIARWDLESGAPVEVIQPDEASIADLIAFPDRRRFASVKGPVLGSGPSMRIGNGPTGGEVAIRDADTLRLVRNITHSDGIDRLSIDPTGRHLAGAGGAGIHLWDARTGRWRFSLFGHREPVAHLAFRPGGRQLVSTSPDESLRVWGVESAPGSRLLRSVPELGSLFSGWLYAIGPSGRWFVSAKGAVLSRVDAETGKVIWSRTTVTHGGSMRMSSGSGTRLELDRAGRRVAWATGVHGEGPYRPGDVLLLDAETGAVRHRLRASTETIDGMDFSPDGARLVTSGHDRWLLLWDVRTGSELGALRVPDRVAAEEDPESEGRAPRIRDEEKGLLSGAVWSPDGRWIAAREGGDHLHVWEAASGRYAAGWWLEERGNTWNAATRTLVFDPAGDRLAINRGDAVLIFEIPSGEVVARLAGHSDGVGSLAFAPGGDRLATVDLGGAIRLWEPGTAQEILTLGGATPNRDSRARGRIRFTADGRAIADLTPDGLRLWEGRWSQARSTLPAPDRPVLHLDFDAKGRRIAAVDGGGTLRLRQVASGRLLGEASIGGAIRHLGISPDGAVAFLARRSGASTSLRAFETRTGRELRSRRLDLGDVRRIAIAPGGGPGRGRAAGWLGRRRRRARPKPPGALGGERGAGAGPRLRRDRPVAHRRPRGPQRLLRGVRCGRAARTVPDRFGQAYGTVQFQVLLLSEGLGQRRREPLRGPPDRVPPVRHHPGAGPLRRGAARLRRGPGGEHRDADGLDLRPGDRPRGPSVGRDPDSVGSRRTGHEGA